MLFRSVDVAVAVAVDVAVAVAVAVDVAVVAAVAVVVAVCVAVAVAAVVAVVIAVVAPVVVAVVAAVVVVAAAALFSYVAVDRIRFRPPRPHVPGSSTTQRLSKPGKFSQPVGAANNDIPRSEDRPHTSGRSGLRTRSSPRRRNHRRRFVCISRTRAQARTDPGKVLQGQPAWCLQRTLQ